MSPDFEGEIPMSLGSNFFVFRVPGVFLAIIAACWPALASEIPVVKPPVELEAAKFVPGELMKGKVYFVRPDAVNDGYVTTYTLETEWGELTAVSDYRLRARIQEAKALKTLDEMSRAGVFGDALVEGALAPVDAVASGREPASGCTMKRIFLRGPPSPLPRSVVRTWHRSFCNC